MTLEPAAPIALYVERGEGRRLVGYLHRVALANALVAAAEALVAMKQAHNVSAEFIFAGEDMAKLLQRDVAVHVPNERKAAFSFENARRNKGERKRNRKWRYR